jgi:hypothetical protein
MISFRKHADAGRRPSEAYPCEQQTRHVPFLRAAVFAVGLFLTTAIASSAQAQVAVGPLAQAAPPPTASKDAANKDKESTSSSIGRAGEAAKSGEAAAGRGARAGKSPAWMDRLPDAPMRVQLAGSPDAPVVVATIGDFAADLGEDGQFFLRREFFEHFVTNVLELGGPSHATPMITFLSQGEDNEREGAFRIGAVSGQISVLVTPRRVFVMCSFSEDERDTRNLARLKSRLSLAS